jgi:maltose-binding protein MalE
MEEALMKRHFCLFLVCVMLISLAAACGGGNDNPAPAGNNGGTVTSGTGGSVTDNAGDIAGDGGESIGAYIAPPSDANADLTIMMWSGDGSFMQDIGHKDYAPEDLKGQNQAAAYATAKEFNKLYPNVRINIFAKTGDPNEGMSWAQHIENFRAEYGKYPDFYAATDIPGDIKKGMCADISVFSNDPVYQSFNEGLMAMMNFNGHQFGLPQYMFPWGVYVNRSLANSQNIDIPNYNWTIEEYTSFTAHSQPNTYYGAMDPPLDFVRTGSKDYVYNLVNRKTGDPYVTMASDSFYDLLGYIPRWANNAVWPQSDIGEVDGGFMDEHWWWSYRYFQMGKLLTLDSDPWMLGDLAHPNPEHWGAAQMSDWDVYPRPSTQYVGNTVGVVLDPFAIHNYAMDDGNPELNDDEYLKLQIAYEFAKFWCADTRSMKARAEQLFQDGDVLKTCLNDSLPMVTGPAFAEQMDIWYSVETHQRMADKNKMPGFQYVLKLWQDGDIWDVSDKSYPWRYEYEGTVRDIPYEYINCWDPEITGARRTEANWLDNIKARMPDWNRQFNERWDNAFKEVEIALEKYYK